MIEFAIVAPVLIFMFMGLVDVGRSMYFGILAANAARAGAAYGAQNLTTAEDTTGMQNAAEADGQGVTWKTVSASYLCSVGGGTPSTCTFSNGLAPSGTVYYVQVQVSGSFTTLIQYPGIAKTIPVSGNSEMRVVNQ